MSADHSLRDQVLTEVSETTPLISDDNGKNTTTPLPKFQLLNIYLVRAVEPLNAQVVYPFINQMLVSVGAADSPETVGYASGIFETAGSIAKLMTAFHWGVLSDRIGRKPVLIMGGIGAIGGTVLGFSNSFTWLVIGRILTTGLNGNMAVIKAVVGELSDETNSALAFSLFPVFLNSGRLLATAIGGAFGDIHSFPNFSQRIPVFTTFPYLLPNLLASIVTLVITAIAAFGLKETLPSRTVKPSEEAPGDPEGYPIEDTGHQALFTFRIASIMASFGLLSLLAGAMGALVPLFCYSPISRGGLGFGPTDIAKAVSVRSLSTLLIQLFIFPPLQRRVGTLKLYRWLMWLWIPTFVGFPLVNSLAGNSGSMIVWVSLSSVLITSSIANMAFVCNLILTTEAAPSRNLLGAINGYSQVVSYIVGLVGPGGAQVLFAVSVNKQLLGGQLVWVIFGVVAVLGVVSSWFITPHVRADR